jgi:hypothetical protein
MIKIVKEEKRIEEGIMAREERAEEESPSLA